MNKTIGLQLVVYGLLLAGLSYLSYHLAPALGVPTLIAGLAGGALCLVWGLRAVAGSRGKALALLTLVPVNFVLLAQAVTGWSGGSETVPGRRTAAVVTTLLFLISFGMLIRIAYAGVVLGGQPASPTKAGGTDSRTNGKPGGHGNGIKRA